VQAAFARHPELLKIVSEVDRSLIGGRSIGRRSSGSGLRARACAGFEGSGVAHPKEADTAALMQRCTAPKCDSSSSSARPLSSMDRP